MKNKIIIEEFKKYIEQEIKKINVPTDLKEILNYVLISNGKYIRPLLFLCYLEDKNIDSKRYYNIALCLEMIHTYSLIHDDLPCIDNDDMRRGKMACHKKYGEDIAVIIGDGLLTNSFNYILKNEEISSKKKVEMLLRVTECAGVEGMILGQYYDLKNLNNNVDEVNIMHELKTSKMLTLPLILASIIVDDNNIDELEKLGQEIGLLYQIQDDYLDQYGIGIGKTIGKDLISGKKNYSYYYEKNELKKILEEKKDSVHQKLDGFLEYKNTTNLLFELLKREK